MSIESIKGPIQVSQLDETYPVVQVELTKKVWKNENLRKEISKDPKSVVERELGIKFAAEVQVKVIDVTEENTVYYVLPHHPSQKLGTEFSDEQLDAIAGGIGFTDVTGMLGQGASALIGGAENLVGKTLGIAGSAISGIGSTVSGIGKKI